MNPRIIAIGDIHLKPGPKQADVLAALDQIIARERSQRVDLWLLLGDLFHTRSTIEDRNAIAPRLQAMADRGRVVVLAGNHDAPGDLDVLGRLQCTYGIRVVSRPETITIGYGQDDAPIAIFCLPYPMKGGLVAAGIAHGDLNAAAAQALDSIFMRAALDLAAAAAVGRPRLMIGHASITGAIASNGQPQMGVEIAVDGAMLARLGHIPKIFGHIHKAQQVEGALYAGSICRLDFGETEEKSYLEIEIHDGAWGGFTGDGPWDGDPSQSWDFRRTPLDVAPLYHVEGHLTREGFTWAVTKGPGGESQPPPATWRGCEVRVRYRYPQSEKAILSQAEILATFAEAKRLEVEPIAVPDRALRAPEVAAAHTLPDKFSAYCAIGGSPATPGMLEKLALLEHKDAGAVLSLVATTVAQIETPQEDQVVA